MPTAATATNCCYICSAHAAKTAHLKGMAPLLHAGSNCWLLGWPPAAGGRHRTFWARLGGGGAWVYVVFLENCFNCDASTWFLIASRAKWVGSCVGTDSSWDYEHHVPWTLSHAISKAIGMLRLSSSAIFSLGLDPAQVSEALVFMSVVMGMQTTCPADWIQFTENPSNAIALSQIYDTRLCL